MGHNDFCCQTCQYMILLPIADCVHMWSKIKKVLHHGSLIAGLQVQQRAACLTLALRDTSMKYCYSENHGEKNTWGKLSLRHLIYPPLKLIRHLENAVKRSTENKCKSFKDAINFSGQISRKCSLHCLLLSELSSTKDILINTDGKQSPLITKRQVS